MPIAHTVDFKQVEKVKEMAGAEGVYFILHFFEWYLTITAQSIWSEIELNRNWKDFLIEIRNFQLWKIPK